ncbi:hypothetical protein PVK06_024272 [Gossypium arboreum]|uniref:Uncharacterized protein n=1 Tax=Gossypium arboreum TaxID=29729 RepID=A0ABR0PDH1_GOSAR|nr:hypothetical protein PVK06_024272 [Gossypium arboreum]
MNTQQQPSIPFKDHMITLIGYFVKATNYESNLDQNTQIEMVFKNLSKDFASFQVVYNLGNKNLTLTQLVKELQSYKLMLNGSHLAQKAEENLAVAFSSIRKGNHTKRNKTKFFGPPKVESKRTKKPKDLSKCFFYNKKGNFKANCKKLKDYLVTKGKR